MQIKSHELPNKTAKEDKQSNLGTNWHTHEKNAPEMKPNEYVVTRNAEKKKHIENIKINDSEPR